MVADVSEAQPGGDAHGPQHRGQKHRLGNAVGAARLEHVARPVVRRISGHRVGVVPDPIPDRCEEEARSLTRARRAGDHLLGEVAHRSAVVIKEEGRSRCGPAVGVIAAASGHCYYEQGSPFLSHASSR